MPRANPVKASPLPQQPAAARSLLYQNSLMVAEEPVPFNALDLREPYV